MAMVIDKLEPHKAVRKLIRLRPHINDFDIFKASLSVLLGKINEDEKKQKAETEEHLKNYLRDFLLNAFYKETNEVNTKDRKDLVIHKGKTSDTNVSVIIEAKRPGNRAEMLSATQPNKKALHELVLYYMQERTNGNGDIQYLIATNIYEWYIFESSFFERYFFNVPEFKNNFADWKADKKVNSNNDYFYNNIAKPYFDSITEDIPCIYFNIKEYEEVLNSQDEENSTKLINLYKLLSPYFLLRREFADDSNQLDINFYKELLHILGLEELTNGGKTIITQKAKKDAGSLIELVIDQLNTEGINGIRDRDSYGTTKAEKYFNIALELCIIWINRILFLKLLEGQLKTFHNNKEQYNFLNINRIKDFAELFNLFHKVLAIPQNDRTELLKQKYSDVPYLNSSLFEISEIERATLKINALDTNAATLELLNTTILIDKKKETNKLPTLEYLFRFLDAYDFATDTKEEIKKDTKKLITASVLGKVFEKINGYKDGAVFTPSYVTMYMCRQAIRRAVVQKFNENYKWDCKGFNELINNIDNNYLKPENRKKYNELINSLKICDPAVGSGHFLVSALNELIAIKHDLKILNYRDKENTRVNDWAIEIDNDELIITHAETGAPFTYTLNEQNKGIEKLQKLQETLFHEKETLIENCLFGVDINQKSVNICRLRLWIELLKNAYYQPHSGYTALETLPNIDINIKLGNSLISRFALQDDLSKALKSIKYNIAQYRGFIKDYRNERNRDTKQGLQKLIDTIKGDFRTEIGKNDTRTKRLQKLNTEYYDKYVANKLFDTKLTSAQKKEKEKLETEIQTAANEIADLENNAIYRYAFEWRFEFPEVLNDNGEYMGFDVVIANPPYIDIKGLDTGFVDYLFSNFSTTENRINLYSIFIELGNRLLAKKGILYFINPNSILMNSSFSKIRKMIAKNVHEIIKLPDNVFSGSYVKVETIILGFQKCTINENVSIVKYKNDEFVEKINKGLADLQSKQIWNTFDDLKFNIYISDGIYTVLQKTLLNTVPLADIADFTLGITPYDKYKGHTVKQITERQFHAATQIDNTYKPIIKGENIQRYFIDSKPKEYIKYGNWLGAPREERFFTVPRVIVRQIVSGNPQRIYAGYTSESLYFTQIGFSIIPQKDSEITPKYLTALLNSTLLNFIHKYCYLDIEKELFQKILIENCKKLPIKKIPIKDQKRFIEKVDKIITAKQIGKETTDLENQIDKMVYQLYELTEEEINIVEAG